MKLFSWSYLAILSWAQKKTAIYYLWGLSFLESFILPYPPPDVLLAPLALKQTSKAYYFALTTTLFSVLGGIVGYSIGYFSYDLILPWLENMNYLSKLESLKLWFSQYGIWTIAIAGFSPIPYKLFTILAGFLSMALLPFILISFCSRGLRFFLVAWFVKKLGTQCDALLKKYIDYLGYSVLLLALFIYLYIEVFT